jgi:hypothetical protein
MPGDPGISDAEAAWLLAIDALLVQDTPRAHALTAGRIFDLWGNGSFAFQQALRERAEAWRERHTKMIMLTLDRGSPCHRLSELLKSSGPGSPKPDLSGSSSSTTPPPRRKPGKPAKRGGVTPSRQTYMPMKSITDAEAARFMELIEAEGISVVFDPGVSVSRDDEVFKPPLIMLDGKGVRYEQIAPAYERGEIEQGWDEDQAPPAWALAIDLTLIVMMREKRWTWQVADRTYTRLPWGHPAKTTPAGRPGWKKITGVLSRRGLIERKSGQTWRLTDAGKVVARQVEEAWRWVMSP